VEAFGFPDHFGDGRGAGIAQKHSVLGSVTEGRFYFYIEPGGDVVYDIGAIIFI
jgi:hypothetical protein